MGPDRGLPSGGVIKLPDIDYRADIDGLRALAVLAVVGYHAFPSALPGGFVGVDVFFVISGFLISKIILDALDQRRFSFSNFYIRRIRRIFPALFIVLTSCFAFGWFALLPEEFMQLGKHIAAGAGFVANFALWSEAGYFDNSADTKPLLHLWSLGVEEQFYFVWPLFVWLLWGRRLNLLSVVLVVASASFLLNVYSIRFDRPVAFFFPSTRLWELLLGALLALPTWTKGKPNWAEGFGLARVASSKLNQYASVLSMVGSLLIFFAAFAIGRSSAFPGWWALLPTLGTAMVISAGRTAWINRVVLSNGILVWFGLISFPLYLWHWPLLSFARVIGGQTPSVDVRCALILASVLLAWLTYEVVERPIRRGVGGNLTVTALLVSVGLIGAVGFYAFRMEGLESRSAVREHKSNMNELARTPPKDADCLRYIGQEAPLFHYCRFTNANATQTVAVIGDSHAHASYPGIASLLSSQGKNSVMLANSGCPPFRGSEYGRNSHEKDLCRRQIEALLDVVRNKNDISTVIFFSRGPYYLTGKEFGEAEIGSNNGPLIEREVFAASLQATINELHTAGKKVYYVTENPELPVSPGACVERPLRRLVKRCDIELETVLERQRHYLAMTAMLKNVTVVNVLGAFCQDGVCRALSDGDLLYADFDHLSLSGSHFQANRALKNFLVP